MAESAAQRERAEDNLAAEGEAAAGDQAAEDEAAAPADASSAAVAPSTANAIPAAACTAAEARPCEGSTMRGGDDAADRAARERQATHPAPAAIAEARFEKPGEPARGGGRFRGKCETVANTFLLSRRETEILFFLAKGHNAAYIQEKLYISEGTAKTHIRHIYRKCDIHNQQDLMRMVEDAQPTE